MEKKQQVSIAQLCAGCPSQFGEFLAYTRSLKFDSKPDIPFLRKLFRDLYHAQGCSSSGKLWDWDSAEADQMLITGAEQIPPGGPIILTGAGGGVVEDDGDLDYDPQDNPKNSKPPVVQQQQPQQRAVTASSMNPRPGTAMGSSWGFGGESKGGLESDANFDSKQGDSQQRRPHTAHGGREPENGTDVITEN